MMIITLQVFVHEHVTLCAQNCFKIVFRNVGSIHSSNFRRFGGEMKEHKTEWWFLAEKLPDVCACASDFVHPKSFQNHVLEYVKYTWLNFEKFVHRNEGAQAWTKEGTIY